MSEQDDVQNSIEAAIIGSAISITLGLAFLAFIIAVVGQKDVTMKSSQMDAHDYHMAVQRCIPYNATFEQELECYKAIYGEKP